MEQVLEGLTMKTCAVYIDDIICIRTVKRGTVYQTLGSFQPVANCQFTAQTQEMQFFAN